MGVPDSGFDGCPGVPGVPPEFVRNLMGGPEFGFPRLDGCSGVRNLLGVPEFALRFDGCSGFGI